MKNKIISGLGILIGVVVLGGSFSGSSNQQVAGNKIEVAPSSIITANPTPTLNPILSPTPTLTPTPQPKATVKPTGQPATQNDSGLSNDNYYTNTQGNEVHSPAYSNSVPAGATALCRDGTYSFSQSRRGTCSSHGGVSQWL